jgi:hypothetical protein
LTVLVGEHRPQAVQRHRSRSDAEVGQVAPYERVHEVVAPSQAGRVIWREKRAGEAPPDPEAIELLVPYLHQRQRIQAHERHPASKRLGDAVDDGRGRAAEQQESRRQRLPVGQHTKVGEDLGLALDFVNDHEPGQPVQGERQVLEPREVSHVLEIEIVGGPLPCRGERTGEGRLADLARAEEGDDRVVAQILVDSVHATAWDEHLPHP